MTNRYRALTAILAACTIALTATACSSGDDLANAPKDSKTFEFTGTILTVQSNAAELELVPADIDEIQVERQISGSVNGNAPASDWDIAGNKLTLTADCAGVSIGCKARYLVKVPRNTVISAENTNGSIKASEISTDLMATTGKGDIQLNNFSGQKLELISDNGNISGDGVLAPSVNATSENGDIQLSFGAVPENLGVKSKDGNVKLALPESDYRVDTRTKSGKVTVAVAESSASQHAIAVETRNGDISIKSGK
ncbi:hypothetical protein CQ018_03545 [Arthrobacter sp. MYb227]|uniref:DUF4097 family beta strand repeat-containing protein n=1 Tax=Arthrobacter sp. MYb227 TaxID=1848601 RepID=UPI000CFE28D5|nr:DUF4097 family beta strand repeat-containing protein [Arthrobacter sp. MYb227]PQZ96350.1 hypothetical protein CQ018_03545 [Arthrobacter sp. MYb227]